MFVHTPKFELQRSSMVLMDTGLLASSKAQIRTAKTAFVARRARHGAMQHTGASLNTHGP
ncbi:hypothetical protein [Limnohabitans sp.]|uniref:hypothetical protein n=1 Tax=Limnohabitans sp. TaxID=1907725 RepID=UPI0039BD21F1|nr:hypothetical protein [Comamonadaceae bacterium]